MDIGGRVEEATDTDKTQVEGHTQDRQAQAVETRGETMRDPTLESTAAMIQQNWLLKVLIKP